MTLNDNINKFKNAVKVGISWNKDQGKLNAVFENSSENIFYLVQGEFLFFNKKKRMIGGFNALYKYIKPKQILFDDFSDMDLKIPDNVETIIFRPLSVDLENPYNSTSVEEKDIIDPRTKDDPKPKTKTKRIFDTDLFEMPENRD